MKCNVHYKERLYFIIMMLISFALYGACFILFFMGKVPISTFCVYAVSFLLFKLLVPQFLLGYLRGNAIKISRKQFPDILSVVEAYSKELGLHKVPDIYVLQAGGALNAFATKITRKNFVILYSDVLEVAYQEGMDAISFIIGHELGHIKRNHIGFITSLLIGPAQWIPFLSSAYSRACEYTCDNIGFSLCPQGAQKGLLVLAAGKTLYKKVDTSELLFNSARESGFAVWLSEIFSSHPVLVKRIASVNRLNNDLTFKNSSFVSPKIDFEKREKQQ